MRQHGCEQGHRPGAFRRVGRLRGTFDNLFPTNHKFYRIMNFVSLQNIQNVQVMGTIKPHPKLNFTAHYRMY